MLVTVRMSLVIQQHRFGTDLGLQSRQQSLEYRMLFVTTTFNRRCPDTVDVKDLGVSIRLLVLSCSSTRPHSLPGNHKNVRKTNEHYE